MRSKFTLHLKSLQYNDAPYRLGHLNVTQNHIMGTSEQFHRLFFIYLGQTTHRHTHSHKIIKIR